MKKAIAIILCAVMVMSQCGCSVVKRQYEVFTDEAPFSIVEAGKNYAICKHDETGVYYIIYSPYGYYHAGITVMLNPDGTPYVWEDHNGE